ncbi:hypothetical protein BJ912DRAFT_106755 [Pholiota molesta]|nr:hypothetical protein BJ912DRAFT_106755 [Pholiota molesta]
MIGLGTRKTRHRKYRTRDRRLFNSIRHCVVPWLIGLVLRFPSLDDTCMAGSRALEMQEVLETVTERLTSSWNGDSPVSEARPRALTSTQRRFCLENAGKILPRASNGCRGEDSQVISKRMKESGMFVAACPIPMLAFYSYSSRTTHLPPRFMPFPTAPLRKLDPFAFERANVPNSAQTLSDSEIRPHNNLILADPPERSLNSP